MIQSKRGFGETLQIGRGLRVFQDYVMRMSNSRSQRGRRYSEHWDRLATDQIRAMSARDRAAYVWLWDHRAEIEPWWTGLDAEQRREWSHAAVIKRHYEAAHSPVAAEDRDRNIMIDPDTGEEIRLSHPSRETQERRHLQFLTEQHAHDQELIRSMQQSLRADRWEVFQMLLEELYHEDRERLNALIDEHLSRREAAEPDEEADDVDVAAAASPPRPVTRPVVLPKEERDRRRLAAQNPPA